MFQKYLYIIVGLYLIEIKKLLADIIDCIRFLFRIGKIQKYERN